MYVGGDLRQRASEREKGEMGKKRHRDAAWLCCCLATSVVSNSVQPHGLQAPLSMGIFQARILE